MTIIRRISAFAAAILLVGSAAAQEGKLKIATVDVQLIFKDYHRTNEAQHEINVERARIQQDNNERLANIREIEEQIEKMRKELEDPAGSQSKKESLTAEATALQQQGISMDRERRDWVQRRNQALNERMVQKMKAILEEIRKLVEERAKAEDFDYVFDKSGVSTSQVPFFLYTNPSTDLTADLLKELNKDAPATPPTPVTPVENDADAE